MAVSGFNVKHFFGNSENGPIFASANYSGTQFEHKLASHSSVDEIKDTLLYQLMTQGGHDSDRDNGSNDNDLNSVFVDFVVRTAQFHRVIDRPTGEHAGVNSFANVLRNAIFAQRNNDTLRSDAYLETDIPAANLKAGRAQPDRSGEYMLVLARIVGASQDMRAANILTATMGNTTFEWVRNKLVTNLSALVMGDSDVTARIGEYGASVSRDISGDVNAALQAAIKSVLDELVNSIASHNHMSDDSVNRAHANISEEFAQMVAERAARAGLASTFATAHTTLSSSSDILRNVYAQWDKSSHDDVRKFYRAFLDVIAKDGSGNWEANPMPENRYNTVSVSGNFRVNLRKVNKVGAILFGETLPLVEVGTKAFYTGSGGVVSEDVSDAKYLTNLYNSVYRGENRTHSGSSRVLQVNKNLVKNLLLSHTPVDRDEVAQPSSGVSLDDYSFEDISTGTMWHRDRKGLYKKEGSDKVYAKDMLASLTEDNNCYGSGLKANCGRVMQCLVDGDSDALGACLEAHKDSNMWEVAEDDIKNMHPNVAVFVLKKFGIKGVHATTANGVRVVVPMELNKWLERLPEDQRVAIKENEQLCNYLKALTDDRLGGVPESRPEYIKDLGLCQYREPVERQSSMKFSSQLIRNMTPYTAPILGVHFGDRYNEATNTKFGVGMLGGAMAGGNYHVGGNVRVGEMSKTMQRRVKDGQVKCAEIHSLTFDNIKSQLNAVGHTLSADDEERINKGIANMSDLESKLGLLHDILSRFIEVGRTFGIDYSKYADRPLKEVDIDRVRDHDSLVRYLATNVEDMKSCINNNAQLQANINNELMKNIFAQMLESGSKDDGLVDL